MCRRYAGPLTGTPLPSGGAPGEQPAALMDLFATLDAIAQGSATSDDK